MTSLAAIRRAVLVSAVPERRRRHLLLQPDATLVAIADECEANPGAPSAAVHAVVVRDHADIGRVTQDTVYWLRRALGVRGSPAGRKPGPQSHDPGKRNRLPPSTMPHGPRVQMEDDGPAMDEEYHIAFDLCELPDQDVGWEDW